MDQSLVYQRIHFLRELGQANKTIRKLLVRYLTREQMEALAEVAGYIVRGSIRVVQFWLIKGTLYGVTGRIL